MHLSAWTALSRFVGKYELKRRSVNRFASGGESEEKEEDESTYLVSSQKKEKKTTYPWQDEPEGAQQARYHKIEWFGSFLFRREGQQSWPELDRNDRVLDLSAEAAKLVRRTSQKYFLNKLYLSS